MPKNNQSAQSAMEKREAAKKRLVELQKKFDKARMEGASVGTLIKLRNQMSKASAEMN